MRRHRTNARDNTREAHRLSAVRAERRELTCGVHAATMMVRRQAGIANGAFGVNGCYFRLQFGAECTQGSLAVPPSGNYHLDMEEEVDVRGLYRTPGFAFVTDNTMTFDIPEAEYRECGYTPDYDSLPSKDA